MENIKRNYVAITLLATSFILFLIDMTSGIVVNTLSIIAFIFTEQITNYISSTERKHEEERKFYDKISKHEAIEKD